MTSRLPIAFTFAAALGLMSLALPAAAMAQDTPPAAPGMARQGCGPEGMAGPEGAGPMRRFHLTPEDRAALLDARLAAVHAGLGLSPDQQKLWPPVESAIRDAAKQMSDARRKMRSEAKEAQGEEMNPITRLQSMAELAQTRATTLKQIAEAAQPLYASLNDDQKRRLHLLMHAMHEHGGPMMMHHGEDDGER